MMANSQGGDVRTQHNFSLDASLNPGHTCQRVSCGESTMSEFISPCMACSS